MHPHDCICFTTMAALLLTLYDFCCCCGQMVFEGIFSRCVTHYHQSCAPPSDTTPAQPCCRVIFDHCMRQRTLSLFIITRGERDCGIIFTYHKCKSESKSRRGQAHLLAQLEIAVAVANVIHTIDVHHFATFVVGVSVDAGITFKAGSFEHFDGGCGGRGGGRWEGGEAQTHVGSNFPFVCWPSASLYLFPGIEVYAVLWRNLPRTLRSHSTHPAPTRTDYCAARPLHQPVPYRSSAAERTQGNGRNTQQQAIKHTHKPFCVLFG